MRSGLRKNWGDNVTRIEEMNIISEVLGGNANAFESLVIENQHQVYTLALKMVGNEDDAYDISQDAFVKAYNNLSKFRGDSKFSVWLYRLTSNLCLDFLRSRKRRSASSTSYINSDDEQQEIEIPDSRFSPETLLEKRELRRRVNAALESLPDSYREIIVLREINGLSYEEIAQVLSLELGTVKSRIFRARKKLCSILLKDGNLSGMLPSNTTKEA